MSLSSRFQSGLKSVAVVPSCATDLIRSATGLKWLDTLHVRKARIELYLPEMQEGDKNSRQMTHSISATNAERVGHPTQKPLAVMRWCLSMAAETKTVLDPFAGSGTTGVAAKLEGRKATLIEISEEYCEKAADRLRQGVLF